MGTGISSGSTGIAAGNRIKSAIAVYDCYSLFSRPKHNPDIEFIDVNRIPTTNPLRA